MKFPVITIDGPSGAGKGTVSLLLAKQLGFHLLESGALYRLSALAAQTKGVDINNESAVAAIAEQLDVVFQPVDNGVAVILNGKDVSAFLRDEEVGMAASTVAAFPKVRDALLELQRNFATAPGLIADGRDMGTTVFPTAPAKIFLTADAETRAARRVQQLAGVGAPADYEQVLADIIARDQNDSMRSVSPLAPADDALVINSSDKTIDEVCALAISHIRLKRVI